MLERVLGFLYNHIGKIIMSLISIYVFPYIILFSFVIYMSYNNFFSYDFLVNGAFGMSLFFDISAAVLLFLSIFISSSVIIIVGYIWRNKNQSTILDQKSFKALILKKSIFGISLFLNLFIVAGIIGIGYELKILPWTFFTIFISAVICAYIGISIFFTFRIQIISYVVFLFLLANIGFGFQEFISNFISIGLRACNVGGNINASVVFVDNQLDQHLDGKLLLLTPQYVFLKHSDGVSMIPINNIKLYTKVEKKTK